MLDGSASADADGDALTFQWSLASKPDGSTAALATPTLAKSEFIADLAGDYVFDLVVNDGKVDSAKASVTVTVALATWRDADCSTDGVKLPACTTSFSDNGASTTVVQHNGISVIQLETLQSATLAAQNSFNSGIKGNRAALSTSILHGMKLSEFPGLTFKAMDDSVGPNTGAGMPYVNYTISKNCDASPTGWANLITNVSDMSPSAPDADGYITYTADLSPGSTAWKSSNWSNAIYATDGTTRVLGPNSDATGGSLQALIQAYPNACIYNWPNPSAQVPGSTTTPAVQILLGNSKNLTAKQSWFKDIKIGDKVIF